MAIKLQSYIEGWKAKAEAFLNAHKTSCNEIVKGVDAWNVAHACRITHDAYDISRDITDAHIQSALEVIFPNVKFVDKKRY